MRHSYAASFFLALLPAALCHAAGIEFSYIPPYGSSDDLHGMATGVQSSDYRVAVYIYVGGWWTKPSFSSPLTTIQGDGSWTCDITTGGDDQNATRIAAYLVPDGYMPAQMSGGQTLPYGLEQNSAARTHVEREQPGRTLQFSGLTWKVKAHESPTGPGPNYFSDSEDDVWTDGGGRLHMRIAQRDGKWYCTEVYTTETLGYGTYTFTLASRVDQLDRNIVLGLFTWDDEAPAYNYREIDIEFSRWGIEANENAQYVVQPYDTAGNMERFNAALAGDASTHIVNWGADSVHFSSFQGSASPPNPPDEIWAWAYAGDDAPPAGMESARINLWLYEGNAPSDGLGAEVVIESFSYTFDHLKINFQPSGAEMPGGYRADSGFFYLTGINFGWQ